MSEWTIKFISREDFKEHVRNTVMNYGSKLESYDLNLFNKNLIDPIKMIFDKSVYKSDWETIIANEIFRQRDKTNTNEIGYFHQRFFEYVENCHVPPNGQDGGWDVIFDAPQGYTLENGNVVHRIYVEMKNKHNTMNSSSSGKTYTKMENQILDDDDSACFLVEAIAKKSQNITWTTTVDKKKRSNNRIRRVSIDKFYEIVTGEPDAFFQICLALPEIVNEILSEDNEHTYAPHDTVFDELKEKASNFEGIPEDRALLLAMYMLGFSTYNGFNTLNKK